jgi:hypothetical protein
MCDANCFVQLFTSHRPATEVREFMTLYSDFRIREIHAQKEREEAETNNRIRLLQAEREKMESESRNRIRERQVEMDPTRKKRRTDTSYHTSYQTKSHSSYEPKSRTSSDPDATTDEVTPPNYINGPSLPHRFPICFS